MSHRRDSSTPRTSFSSTHETNAAILCGQIQRAVAKTVEGLDVSIEKQTRCFLSRGELDRILTTRALEDLFRELVLGTNTVIIAPTIPGADLDNSAERERESHPSNIDTRVQYYVQRTMGTPSRKALLALFLYLHREQLFSLFLGWLRSDDLSTPSDDWMPFTEVELNRLKIPFWCQQGILTEQVIFKPVTIQKFKHHKFNSDHRLPFLGRQLPIKEGSSGNVVRTEIAQYHWDMKNDDEVVPGNPNSTAVVALKIFKKGADGGMDEATRDFNIELNILKQLRKCKTKHDAIMLDWGSITIVDNQGAALSHSLIFKLATFSLEDLLKDEKRAQRYLRKNVLLAGLVDVVEALECLHEKVHTFHFDIKPDNILIFEKKVQGPESEVPDQYELIWKLSDFGLARKKVASQKASMSSGSATPSVSSTLPATRPPGLYQAPEVQQQNVSAAGQGSDVWSMGIVALMVLAYMSNGPTEVLQLKAWLNVSFPNGGKEPLTYVRSDQRSWRHRKDHKCCYLPNHDPDTGSIPGSKLKAALNPKLIEWSNDLYLETYHLRPERTLVKRILEVIFGSVLLIDRGRRMCAADVRKTLAKIQEDWSLCDTNPESYKTRNNISDIYCSDSRSSQEASQGESPEEPSASQDAESDHRRHRRRHDMDLTPSIVVTGPPNTQQGIPGSSRDLKPSSVQAPIGERPESQESSLMVRRDSEKSQEERIETLTPEPNVRTPERSTWVQESLCSAIEKNDPTSVRLQLRERGRDQLSQICPGARRLPIHWALCKNAYDALDVLLEHSSKEITNLVCNRRTALDLACEQGKPAALDCIRKYREKFDFPPEVYRKRHKNLGYEAKVIADDLFEIGRVVSPRKRSFFGLIRSRGSDTSG